jgi:hypothetical protein
MHWEYKTVVFPASGGFLGGRVDAALLNARMNELGEQRWELVSALSTNQGYGWSRNIVAMFKRPKQ